MNNPANTRGESMACPLCGAILTAERDQTSDGRFHCQACAPTSVEARRGWIRRVMPKAASLEGKSIRETATPYANDPMFATTAAGEPVTRQRVCECGTGFTQRQLSARFCEAVERAGDMQLVMRQIPDLFVPVHCPRCERVDLGRQARMDATRRDERPVTSRQPKFTLAAD